MFNSLFGKKEPPKYKAEMETIMPQLEERFMVVGRDGTWKPRVSKLLDKSDVDGLIKLLDNPNQDINTGVAWSVRLQAILALGAIGNAKAVETLTKITNGDLPYASAQQFRLAGQIILKIIADSSK